MGLPKAPCGKSIFDGFCRGKVQTSADFSSLDASKDAKIYCRRACGFDSRAARQEGQIRTRFYKANICIYFDKFPRNIRILLRKFVLSILNICSSKTQRPSSLNFKMILVLAECRQVRTLQARQVPKALKIQASGRVRICPSCLTMSKANLITLN